MILEHICVHMVGEPSDVQVYLSDGHYGMVQRLQGSKIQGFFMMELHMHFLTYHLHRV